MNSFNKKMVALWLYLITDCIMFTIIFLSLINSKCDFNIKKKILNYRIFIIETSLLLFCSFLSTKLLNSNKIKYYFLIILLSLFFLIIEFKDLHHLTKINLNFNYNNFLSNFFFLLIFHALHIIISIIFAINLIFLKKINFNIKICNIFFSIFWHFIHIIWLLILLTLFYIK